VNHAKLVGVFGKIWKKLGDPESRLAMLCELEWRTEERCSTSIFADLGRLTRTSIQNGFVIKQIDMRRASIHA
jgi:hypothetical protein